MREQRGSRRYHVVSNFVFLLIDYQFRRFLGERASPLARMAHSKYLLHGLLFHGLLVIPCTVIWDLGNELWLLFLSIE